MFHRLFILLCVFACGNAGAQEAQAQHARVELISQQTSFAPGQENLLGIHFSLEKDWHIYWINPGDSGQPPVFQWQLPAGFRAGEVRWPRPEKLKTSQSADYGYKDDVVLLVPVQIPYNVKHNFALNAALDLKWLICREG